MSDWSCRWCTARIAIIRSQGPPRPCQHRPQAPLGQRLLGHQLLATREVLFIDLCRFDMFCRRVFEIAPSSNWTVTGELLQAARMPFTTLGGTAINEHGVRELRQQEQVRSGWSKQVANKNKWDALAASTVISGVHGYHEVPWRAEVPPRNMSQGLIEGVFLPDLALCPAWVRSVVGPNRTPKWYSPAPLSAIQQSIDMQLVKHFDGLGDPRRITDVWLAALCRSGRMAVKHKRFGEQCFLCWATTVELLPLVGHFSACVSTCASSGSLRLTLRLMRFSS